MSTPIVPQHAESRGAGSSSLRNFPATYGCLDPRTVAALMEWHAADFKYDADADLEAVIAHANLIFDVALYEGEIEHATEWLDMVHAERCAAMSVLARRSERGYAINVDRPGGFDRAFLDDLKMRVSVRELVEATGARLYRRGRGWVACCPLPDHDDRYPSFYVYDDMNSVHCFGCGQGGDVFDLVMLLEGVEFPEAVRWVAVRAGVEIPGRHKPRIRGRMRNVAT